MAHCTVLLFLSVSLERVCIVEMDFSLCTIEEASGKDGHASASLLNCLQCPAKLRNDLSKSGLRFIPLSLDYSGI